MEVCMNNMAICWTGIGEYNILFVEFYRTFSKEFCADMSRSFFIFTDRPELYKDVENPLV